MSLADWLPLGLAGHRLVAIDDHAGRVAYLQDYLVAAGLPPDDAKVEAICRENLVWSRLYALTRRDGARVGGFALGPSLRSRWPGYLKPEVLAAFPFDLHRCEDLNFVYLEPARRGTLDAAILWLFVSRVVGGSEAERILYLTDSRNAGLIRLYQAISEGEVGELEMIGFSHPQRMFWSTPARFRRLPGLYWRGLTRRMLRAEPGSG